MFFAVILYRDFCFHWFNKTKIAGISHDELETFPGRCHVIDIMGLGMATLITFLYIQAKMKTNEMEDLFKKLNLKERGFNVDG